MIKSLIAEVNSAPSSWSVDGVPQPPLIFLRMDQSSEKAIEHLSGQLGGGSEVTSHLDLIYNAFEYFDPTFGTFSTIMKFAGLFFRNHRLEQLQMELKKASNDHARIVDAVGALRSKLNAMKNRMKEVNNNYYEAPLSACLDHADEVISQFTNEKLVFLEYPLGGAPHIATFCKRHKRLSDLFTRYMDDPKYEAVRRRIKIQSEQLRKALDKYEDKCVARRLTGIDMRLEFDPPSDPEHWNDWSCTYHLSDFYASVDVCSGDQFPVEEYKAEVVRKYKDCFKMLKHKLELCVPN